MRTEGVCWPALVVAAVMLASCPLSVQTEVEAEMVAGSDLTSRIPAIDVLKACEFPIETEAGIGAFAPSSLEGLGFQGKWAYEQTNRGVIKHELIEGTGGKMDVWVESDRPESELGIIRDVSAIFYLTTEDAKDTLSEGTLPIRALGQYVPQKGILCMVGCQEPLITETVQSEDPKNANATGPSITEQEAAEEAAEEAVMSEDEDIVAGAAEVQHVDKELQGECKTRIVLRFQGQEGSRTESEVTGRVESLKEPGDPGYFTPIIVTAHTGTIATQMLWFELEMLVEAFVYVIQATCLLFQIAYSRKDHEAYYVSQTLTLLQIFVYGFFWLRSLYYPLRYLNAEILFYFLSDFANVPRFVEFAIFILYVWFAVLIDTKRRKAKGSAAGHPARSAGEDGAEESGLLGGASSGPGFSERRVAVVFWPVYGFVGACMWFTFDFDSFLRMSLFLFLLPQILANFLWDPPAPALQAVTIVFAVGNTAAQMFWLTYEVLRPRLMGYDSFFAFPHAWYWTSMLLMALSLGAFLGQRSKGGRFSSHESQLSPSETELASATV